jgi:hypothetical protein
MRGSYTTPTLRALGSVSAITQASADSDRQDFTFDAAGVLEGTGTGYLDRCFFVPGTDQCIIAP